MLVKGGPGGQIYQIPSFFEWLTINVLYLVLHVCILEPCHHWFVKACHLFTTYTLQHILTHWGRVTHICVSKQTIIGSDNGLSPGRRQAIIWTNAGLLLIGTLGTNFSEILIEIGIFSFKKMGLKVSSAKWRPFCLSLNVLKLLRLGKPITTKRNAPKQLWLLLLRKLTHD